MNRKQTLIAALSAIAISAAAGVAMAARDSGRAGPGFHGAPPFAAGAPFGQPGFAGHGGPGLGGPGFGGPGRMAHGGKHGDGKQALKRYYDLTEDFDKDGDGAVTQAEVDATRADRFAKFDANGDGKLDLAEYQALWLDAMHERMVDRFQSHDDDGDAGVTLAEFQNDFKHMVEFRDRNDDGRIDKTDFTSGQKTGYHGKGGWGKGGKGAKAPEDGAKEE